MKRLIQILIILLIGILYAIVIIFSSAEIGYHMSFEIFYTITHNFNVQIFIAPLIALTLIIIIYSLSFKTNTKKKFRPNLVRLANILLLSTVIFYLAFWYIKYFIANNSIELISFEAFVSICILSFLTSIIFNIFFLSSLITNKNKWSNIFFLLIPFASTFFLSYQSFLDSQIVLWTKLNKEEVVINRKEILNIDFKEDSPIWYKGLSAWITYKEFREKNILRFIK